MVNQKKILSMIVMGIMLVSVSVAIVPTTKATTMFHVIKGTLYIDDEIAGPGVIVQFDIPERDYTSDNYYKTTEQDQSGYNFYSGAFDDATYKDTTVYFTIVYIGDSFTPIDNTSVTLNKNTNDASLWKES